MFMETFVHDNEAELDRVLRQGLEHVSAQIDFIQDRLDNLDRDIDRLLIEIDLDAKRMGPDA